MRKGAWSVAMCPPWWLRPNPVDICAVSIAPNQNRTKSYSVKNVLNPSKVGKLYTPD